MKKLCVVLFGLSLHAQLLDYNTQLRNKPPIPVVSTASNWVRTNGLGLSANLSSTGSNTVTLTPCPLGVNGTNNGHYIYISGGTGTAETVLITGGSCTSAAATGTLTFTTVNTHTGSFQLTTASGGIQEAIWTLGANGGIVDIVPGTYNIYQTITVGNGSASGQSTRNGVFLRGVNSGTGPSELTLSLPQAAVKLFWTGPTNGTMLRLNGPYSAFALTGILFDCGAAGVTASTAFESNHNVRGYADGIKTVNCNSYAIKEYAYDSPTGVFIGSNTYWNRISIEAGTNGGAAASGFQIGAAAYGSSPHLDVAQSVYNKVFIQCTNVGGTGVGFNARFTDVLTFYSPVSIYCLEPFKITPATSNSLFPQSLIQFDATYIGNNIANPWLIVDSSWTAPNGMTLWPMHTGDGEKIPVHASVKGMDDQGRIFGFSKFYGEYTEDGRGGVWHYSPSASGPNNAVFNWLLTSDTTSRTYQGIANRASDQWQFNADGTTSYWIKPVTGDFFFNKAVALASLTRTALLAITPAATFTMYGCSDCNRDATCTAGGTGARAIFIAGAWTCN